MTGSWFLLREESLDKARERLSQDIYATGGAWDMSKVGSANTSFHDVYYCHPRPGAEADCMRNLGMRWMTVPSFFFSVADPREERLDTGQATITPVAIAKH